MTRLAVALESALDPAAAAAALAAGVEAALGDPGEVAGALVLATTAAGRAGAEIGERLAARWPGAELLGTSFEGLVLDGRVWQGEPAVAVVAWLGGESAPIPIVCEAGERDPLVLAKEIFTPAGRVEAGPGDLVLLFPDALGTPALLPLLESFSAASAGPQLAGAAAAPTDDGGCAAWTIPADSGDWDLLLGLLLPGEPRPARPPRSDARVVRCVGATRIASPWLEITACRSHWIDALEGETPLVWIRRQLGLADDAPIEPHLERLLVRIGRRSGTAPEDEPVAFEERYVSGVDERRGSIGIMGVFARGDLVALALPDPGLAREDLRSAVDALPATPLILQFGCPGRGESLHGDRDLESAVIAHRAAPRRVLGVVAPFQLGTDATRSGRFLVHSTVLAAVGPIAAREFVSPDRSN